MDYSTRAKDKVIVEKSLNSINRKLLGLQKTLTDFDAIAKINEARIFLASRASKIGNSESALSMASKKEN